MLVSPIIQNNPHFAASQYSVRGDSAAIGSDEALLMLQDPKSTVIFKKNQNDAKKANTSDPITSLGYKLYRTFKYIVNNSFSAPAPETSAEKDKFAAIA